MMPGVDVNTAIYKAIYPDFDEVRR